MDSTHRDTSPREILELAQLSGLHLAEIREDYTRRFPGKWIAVVGRHVYGPTDTPEELWANLENLGVDTSAAQLAHLEAAFMMPMVL